MLWGLYLKMSHFFEILWTMESQLTEYRYIWVIGFYIHCLELPKAEQQWLLKSVIYIFLSAKKHPKSVNLFWQEIKLMLVSLF